MGMSQYMRAFGDEACDHLQVINQLLLDLESDPTNADILSEAFRIVHTLKGMSATMGFGKIAELTREMEKLLDKLRRGEVGATTGIIDILFSSFDALRLLVEEVISGRRKDIDVAPTLRGLREPGYILGQPSDMELIPV